VINNRILSGFLRVASTSADKAPAGKNSLTTLLLLPGSQRFEEPNRFDTGRWSRKWGAE
jgi:hypothetical protein